jgi:hypothetical protein
MKPFNDSVQSGEPLVYGPTGEEYYFVGTTKAGNVVAERETCSYALTLDRKNVFLPPKQTTFYVNVYRDTSKRISLGGIMHSKKSDAEECRNPNLTYLKTISFEVKE